MDPTNPVSTAELIGGLRPPTDASQWGKAFRKAFPEALKNGVSVVTGGNIVQIKIGKFDEQGLMASPAAVICLELDSKGKWNVDVFRMKEKYYGGEPSGRLLDLDDVVNKKGLSQAQQIAGIFIDGVASGKTFHEAFHKADNIGLISDYIEAVESERIVPHVVRTEPVTISGRVRLQEAGIQTPSAP